MQTETKNETQAAEVAENQAMTTTRSEVVENTTTAEAAEHAVRVVPPVDVVEMGEAVRLVADLPGVAADAVKLEVKEGYLTLDALQEPLPQGAPIERKRFMRRFTLGDLLDPDSIEAKLEHGVLTLTIAKSERAKPRTIAVTGG